MEEKKKKKAPKPPKSDAKAAEKEGFGNDKKGSASEKQIDYNSMGASSPRLQKNMSTKTLASKATQDTLAGSVVAPPFKFGVQKQYKLLGEFEVSSKLLLNKKPSGDLEMV